MAKEQLLRDIVFSQELVRIKCEIESLEEQIEIVCGFNQYYFPEYRYLKKYHLKLCFRRKKLLDFLRVNKIPIVSQSGFTETIEELFEHCKPFSSQLQATNVQNLIAFGYYIRNYYFPDFIPKELQLDLKLAHDEIIEDLRSMLRLAIRQEKLKKCPPSTPLRRSMRTSEQTTTTRKCKLSCCS